MDRILLIEDNFSILENLTEFLHMEGYEILSANCGEDGVEMAKKELPDLIICDVLMYEMSGHDVLKVLLNCDSTVNIPFIFSTSLSEKMDKLETIALGADDYIVKPYEMEKLLIMIKFWLTNGSTRNLNWVMNKIDTIA
jgi:DNA-binding response OmpR family regulator